MLIIFNMPEPSQECKVNLETFTSNIVLDISLSLVLFKFHFWKDSHYHYNVCYSPRTKFSSCVVAGSEGQTVSCSGKAKCATKTGTKKKLTHLLRQTSIRSLNQAELKGDSEKTLRFYFCISRLSVNLLSSSQQIYLCSQKIKVGPVVLHIFTFHSSNY